MLAVLLVVSCSKDDPATEEPTPTTTLSTFAGPTYPDNYTPIASWNSRSQWNLANVHDPTIEKSGDYYYMYQTDASYGNDR